MILQLKYGIRNIHVSGNNMTYVKKKSPYNQTCERIISKSKTKKVRFMSTKIIKGTNFILFWTTK